MTVAESSMTKIKMFLTELYYATRYRKWVVYDPSDVEVIYIGTRKDCYKVQNQSHAGLVVTPFQNPK